MPFIAYPDEHYENLCQERYEPAEYEMVEGINNPYMTRLINDSKISISSECQFKNAYEKLLVFIHRYLFYLRAANISANDVAASRIYPLLNMFH